MIENFLKAKLFMPDDYKKSIFDIDFQSLKNFGISALLIDVDNTLIPYDESVPSEKLIDLFDQIKKIGFSIMIISNNHRPRIQAFSTLLGCPFVAQAKKPLKIGFNKAIKLLGIQDFNKVCVIGDQMMTDVFGAKRIGLKVILVDAIKRNNEKWFTRMNRRIEKRMLTRIKNDAPEYFSRLKLAEKR
jgi:HAD superfamily phosphatase (TIGR01668 family)